MMIIVNRYENSITGSLDGKPFGISYSEEKYTEMKELETRAAQATTFEELKTIKDQFEPLIKEDFKTIVETVTPFIGVNKAQNKYYLKFEDGTYDDQPLPKALVERILKSIEQKIDILPLIKFWIRFRRNPQFSEVKAYKLSNYINKTYIDHDLYQQLLDEGLAQEVAQQMATSYQTPITVEGLLVTYKVSREKKTKWTLDADGNKKEVPRYGKTIDEETGIVTYDEPEFVEERVYAPAVQGDGGDEFYCDDKLGHIIKVGRRHWLKDWNQVNTNDNVSCKPGLHAGNLDYIRGYQGSGTITHNVFIDPMYIGAITDDGSGALRLKEYFVYGSFQGVTKSLYHSSTYAAIGDKEFLVRLAEIQAERQKSIDSVVKAADVEKAIWNNLAPKVPVTDAKLTIDKED